VISLLQSVQIRPETHRISLSVGNILGGKADHSPPSVAEVKNEWSDCYCFVILLFYVL
jgi:hypothetical protein